MQTIVVAVWMSFMCALTSVLPWQGNGTARHAHSLIGALLLPMIGRSRLRNSECGLSARRRKSGRFSGAVSERDARGRDCGAGRGAGQPDGTSGMKVLIDEGAPKAMKVALVASGFDCTTVQEAG